MSGKKKGLDVSDLEYEEELSQEALEEKAFIMEQRRKSFESYVSQLKHKGQYTLAGEIDRCLKKVSEGIETFKDIWQKLHNATNANQKERYDTDLKKEIKKLQRLRDQIKSWIASAEIKDKTTLIETRKLIETQMERFKVVERETKTKAYSREGLGAAQKQDPTTKEREDLNHWLVASIDQMQIQLDQFECEIESLLAGKKKRQDKDRQDRLDRLKAYMDRHSFHMGKLETLMRMLDNLSVDVNTLRKNDDELLQFRKFLTQVKKIKDDIEYYLESNQEPEFEENEFLYDDIDGLEEFDEGLVQQQALGNSVLLAGGDGDLVGKASSTPGNSSPVSPMHSRNSSKDRNKRRKSLEDSFKAVREVAVKANNVGPSPRNKESPPKGVGTPDNFSSNSSSSSSQTQNQQNTLDNVQSLRGTSVIASAVALVNTSCNGSGDSGEEQLHLSDSSIVSPRNPPNKHAMENSMHQTAPSSPETLVTKSYVSVTKPKMASLAELSALAMNSNSGLMDVLAERKFVLPPAPLPQGSGSNSLDASSPTVISQISNINVFNLPTSYLSSVSSSTSIHGAGNINNNMIGASSEFTGPNSSGSTSNNIEHNSATNISDALNNINFGLADYASTSSHGNSTILTQKEILSQGPSTSQPGNSRGTTSTSNISDYFRLQPEPIPMNCFMYHEGEPMASLKSMAKEFVDRTGINPNHSGKTDNKKTTEVHMPPLLGVTPLGPVPLQKEHHFQLKMLEASFNHMPVRADSERMRQFLPRNSYPTPQYYPQKLLTNSNSLEYYQKLSTETLFFIFYYLEGTKAQYLAAKVLKNQSWRFHTKYMMWFQRHETPKVINEEYEQGTYIYFDFEKWGQRKKEGFVFEYRYLEDKDL